MRFLAVLLASAFLAGCTTPAAEETVPAAESPAVPALPEPIAQEFRGRITASPISRLAHVNADLELAVAPVQREGFIVEVVAVPTVLRIDLSWEAASPGAAMFAMVNIPTTTAGKVLDVFSERSDSGSVCMLVPVEEIRPGPLSVMAHSVDAVGVDWTMRVTNVGGEVEVHGDRGHMEVERGEAEERDSLPCEDEESAS